MMNQFAVWRTLQGRKLVIADRPDYDPTWGFWRFVKALD